MNKSRVKLEKFLGGIRKMNSLPKAVFVIDAQKDHIAILEARKAGVKVYGICDTNCNPELFDYFIPANDDAIKSIAMISNKMAEAITAGKNGQTFDVNVLNEATEKQNIIDKEARDKEMANRPPRDPNSRPYYKKPYVKPRVQSEGA